MENASPQKTLKTLLQDPSEIEALISNPGKYGLDFYKSLSSKNQQYIVFAAAAGLIAYGIYLGKQKG